MDASVLYVSVDEVSVLSLGHQTFKHTNPNRTSFLRIYALVTTVSHNIMAETTT